MQRPAVASCLLLLVTTLAAGCLDADDGGGGADLRAARLACHDGRCNVQATVAPATRQANELSIAVNPTDPDNILVVGKDYTPDQAGQCVWDGIYTTHDGGATWTNANLPDSNWKRLADLAAGRVPAPPGPLARYWCATDPVVAFGPDGTAYWAVMPYQCDPASGSKTGRGVLPQGGLNDWFWTCSSMHVLVSEDGGDTWPILREVAFGPRLEHDKMWLSVAPDGRVLLCWDRDASLVSTGTPADQLRNAGSVVCSVSKDKGRSWAPFATMNPDWVGFLPWVDWSADGRAFAAVVDGANVLVTTSSDGLTWSQPVVVGTYEDPSPGGEYGWPVLRGSDFRVFALPSLAVDRSDGPHGGSIYVTWFDHAGGDGEAMLSFSRDGGATWSEPRRISHDDPSRKVDQFMPVVAVGPDGTVDASWFDRRDDAAGHLFALYYSYSLDGGVTFAPDLRVQQELGDEQYSHHQNGAVFLGDYIDIDSARGEAHPVWVDTRNGKADAFTATVLRPSANDA